MVAARFDNRREDTLVTIRHKDGRYGRIITSVPNEYYRVEVNGETEMWQPDEILDRARK